MEATAIVKGTKNLAVAKKVADWGATKDAERALFQDLRGRGLPGREEHAAELSRDAEKGMIKNDFGWMAENRDRILAEWSKRYESKAAPK